MAHVHSKKPLFRAAWISLVLCPPRSIPSRYQTVDSRRTIKVALHTDSLIIARERRDSMMDAGEHFWETNLVKQTSLQPEETPEMCRYRSARRRALAVGFEFKPLNNIERIQPSEALLERLKHLEGREQDTREV